MRRSLMALAVAAFPLALAGQARGLCWTGHPQDECRGIVVTSAGAYEGSVGFRAVIDVGYLRNISANQGVGATWFFSFDGDEFSMGPMVRWRRWLSRSTSYELGLGIPFHHSTPSTGIAVHGLAQLNLGPVGIVLRPEWRRRDQYFCAPCEDPRRSRFVMSAGVELGGPGGFVVGSVGGVLVAIVAVIYGYSD